MGETLDNDGPYALLRAYVAIRERLMQCDDIGLERALDEGQGSTENSATNNA